MGQEEERIDLTALAGARAVLYGAVNGNPRHMLGM